VELDGRLRCLNTLWTADGLPVASRNSVYELRRALSELQYQLSVAHEHILSLVREPFRAALKAYSQSSTNGDLADRQLHVVNLVIEVAEAAPVQAGSGYPAQGVRMAARADCPLCGGQRAGMAGPSEFALPDGLKRHLTGSHKMERCFVMDAALRLAMESVRRAEEG
jgi:hypothetical protein